MIQRFLPSALCICLSPLLAAQQGASVNIPEDTTIKLVSLERVSSKTAVRGTRSVSQSPKTYQLEEFFCSRPARRFRESSPK